jgi:hypothetical protein
MDEPLDSCPFDVPTLSLVGWRLKFYIHLEEPPFIGECVSIFKVENGDGYYLGINFDNENDVVGVRLDDIQAVTRLKRIAKSYEVITLADVKKQKETKTDA